MAFSFAKDGEAVAGDKRFTSGTFTNSTSTGGNIYTGLSQIDGMWLQQGGDAVVASQAVINETFPCHDPVTIVTANNATGWWMAFGS